MTEVNHIWRLFAIGLAIALIGCFAAGYALQSSELLDLKPPSTWDNPNPNQDISSSNILPLYVATLVGWLALILLIPVYIFVWTERRTVTDSTIWQAFWTMSFVTFVVHQLIWTLWFFGGDFAEGASSSRTPALGLTLMLAVLWAIDVKLALGNMRSLSVTIFRSVVHVLVFIFFFVEIGMSSELTIGKLLGVAMLASLITGLTLWLRELTKRKVT